MGGRAKLSGVCERGQRIFIKTALECVDSFYFLLLWPLCVIFGSLLVLWCRGSGRLQTLTPHPPLPPNYSPSFSLGFRRYFYSSACFPHGASASICLQDVIKDILLLLLLPHNINLLLLLLHPLLCFFSFSVSVQLILNIKRQRCCLKKLH